MIGAADNSRKWPAPLAGMGVAGSCQDDVQAGITDSQSRGHCPQLPHVAKRVHFALLHLPAGVTPSAYIGAIVDT